MVILVSAQSATWSISMRAGEVHPSIEHSPAENHSRAVFCSTVGLRPRWTTLSISVPFVVTAATNASPSIIRHASATGIGPCPAISHTSPGATDRGRER